jgi:hypothetical protein
MNRLRLNIPPGSLLDEFGRMGDTSAPPAPGFAWEMPGGEPGELKPFFPGLTPEDMNLAMQTFGLSSPVGGYPQSMNPGDIAKAFTGGMQSPGMQEIPQSQGLLDMVINSKKGGVKGALKKAAPYLVAAGVQALTSSPAPQKIEKLNLSAPSAIPGASLSSPGYQPQQVAIQSSPTGMSPAFGNSSRFLRGY